MALLDGTSFRERIETVFVIGGGKVYEEALPSPLCSAVHFTAVTFASIPATFRIKTHGTGSEQRYTCVGHMDGP